METLSNIQVGEELWASLKTGSKNYKTSKLTLTSKPFLEHKTWFLTASLGKKNLKFALNIANLGNLDDTKVLHCICADKPIFINFFASKLDASKHTRKRNKVFKELISSFQRNY